MSIHNPSKNETGEYTCEVRGVDGSGHFVLLSSSTHVNSTSPTTAELAAYIPQLQREVKDVCKKKPGVFFSVAVTHHMDISSGHVVFDRVLSNFGGGFDQAAGVFVCPTPGYYRLNLNALAQSKQRFYLYLQLNGQNVFAVYARAGPGNQGGSSNSAIVHLTTGDVIRVVTNGRSVTFGTPNDLFVTCSGQLVSAD